MSNIISFFQKLIKGGVGIRAGGGWKIFQKLICRGGGDYSVLESTYLTNALGGLEKSFHFTKF